MPWDQVLCKSPNKVTGGIVMRITHEIEKSINNNEIEILIKLHIALEVDDIPPKLANCVVKDYIPPEPVVDHVESSNNSKVIYTASDIQSILGLSKNTTYELLNSGKFPVKKLGRKMLISKEYFDKWLNENK